MKKGFWYAFSVALIATFGLFSCAKEYNDRYCDAPTQVESGFDTTMVNIRVVNYTKYALCNFEVIYRTDLGDVYRYGTIDPQEETPYSKHDFVKVFPEVTFTLGTGNFTINDTLATLPKYSELRLDAPGFYSLLINFNEPLDSQRVITSYVFDEIQRP